jgi:hypothetical protein
VVSGEFFIAIHDRPPIGNTIEKKFCTAPRALDRRQKTIRLSYKNRAWPRSGFHTRS